MSQKKQSFFKKNKKEIILVSLSILIFTSIFYFLFFNKNKNSFSFLDKTSKGENIFNFGNLFDFTNKKEDKKQKEEEEDYTLKIGYSEGLIKVWDKPVAGYNFYYKDYTDTYLDEYGIEHSFTNTKTILQFVDSETGFIYEKDLLNPTSTPYQITSDSYPNTVKAYFMNDNNGNKSRVFLQYLKNDTIKTVSATLPAYYNTPAKLLNILDLPDNIINFTLSTNNEFAGFVVKKTKIKNNIVDYYSDWYLFKNIQDSYGERIYSSEFYDWKMLLTNKGDVYAYSNESALLENVLYKLERNESNSLGNLNIIFSGYKGMSFLINNNNLLTSILSGSGLKLYINENFKGEYFELIDLYRLNFLTLANKCTQIEYKSDNLIICSVPKEIKSYTYGLPDAWYQGMTSWEDSLYIVNNDYQNGTLLFDFKSDGYINEIIDGKNLSINERFATHLGFINKNDSSLWTLNILRALELQ